MNNRPSPKKGVIIIRWFVVPAMVLAGGLLIGSNLALQTKSARSWFERKLERKSGLDWTLASLSWTPWSGIHVNGAKAELVDMEFSGKPLPLYQVKDIDVRIYWSELLNGSLEVREIRVKNAHIAIPIELMALLQGKNQEQGALAEGDPKVPKPPKSTGSAKKPGPNAGVDKTGSGKPPAAGKKPTPAKNNPVVERPPAARPMNLVIEGCEVSIYSVSGKGKGGLALKNLRAEVPLAGEDRRGWIEADGLSLGGTRLSDPIRTDLEWKRPLLVVPATTMEWAGLQIHAGASVQMRGVPRFLAEVRVPAAPLEPTAVPGWPDLAVSSQNVAVRSRIGGSLTDLRSWQGSAFVDATNVMFAHRSQPEGLGFELARLSTVMRAGVFQIVDARLISEQLSFLGNALVVPDGRIKGVMRVVADHENARAITRIAVGSLLSQGWTRSWFEPLVTPDRQFRDLHVEGTLTKAVIDVGRKGEELDVNQAWNRMVAFVKTEERETDLDVPHPLPREELIPQ